MNSEYAKLIFEVTLYPFLTQEDLQGGRTWTLLLDISNISKLGFAEAGILVSTLIHISLQGTETWNIETNTFWRQICRNQEFLSRGFLFPGCLVPSSVLVRGGDETKNILISITILTLTWFDLNILLFSPLWTNMSESWHQNLEHDILGSETPNFDVPTWLSTGSF